MKEVCRRCGLTKKAVEYYETRGLIAPSVRENGYRDYSQEDLRTLKEIAVLRQCGIGVPDIGEILAAEDPRAALEKWKTLADLRAQRMENIRACVDGLIQTYDVEGAFQLLQEREEDLLTVRERMILEDRQLDQRVQSRFLEDWILGTGLNPCFLHPLGNGFTF